MANLAIVGLGPAGLATGVAFAAHGHRVVALDVDDERSEHVRRAELPFFEAGMKAALRKVMRQKRLVVAGNFEEVVLPSEFVFLCVGTPSRADGSMDDSALVSATMSVAQAARDAKRRVLVVKSTVLPGTTESVVRPILERFGRTFHVAVNPEFLREGRAQEDALHPDRIVIGVSDPITARKLRNLYRFAKCPLLVTDLRTAEAIKYATNAFLATKVAFANELANLCQVLGVSYDKVLRGLALDPRVNPSFLVPGVGFGGSCLPKDLRALVSTGQARGYDPILLRSVLAGNDAQYLRAIAFLEAELGDLQGKRIALLGLAFKGGTDDVRESRAIPIAQTLITKGATVVGYDPLATRNFVRSVPEIKVASTIQEALRDADGCLVQANWPVFSKLTAKDFLRWMASPVVVDGRRVLNPRRQQGIRFFRIG